MLRGLRRPSGFVIGFSDKNLDCRHLFVFVRTQFMLDKMSDIAVVVYCIFFFNKALWFIFAYVNCHLLLEISLATTKV